MLMLDVDAGCWMLLLLRILFMLLLLCFNYLGPNHPLRPNCFQGIDSRLLLNWLLLGGTGVATTSRVLNRSGAELVSGKVTVKTDRKSVV